MEMVSRSISRTAPKIPNKRRFAFPPTQKKGDYFIGISILINHTLCCLLREMKKKIDNFFLLRKSVGACKVSILPFLIRARPSHCETPLRTAANYRSHRVSLGVQLMGE